MRPIDDFDRAADLYPDRHRLRDGVKALKSVDFIAALSPYWAGRERKI